MLVITERAVTHSVAAETTFMQCSSDLGLRSTGLTCLCKVEHEAKKKKQQHKKRLTKPHPTSFMADTLTTQP